jgi:hypothetical protein
LNKRNVDSSEYACVVVVVAAAAAEPAAAAACIFRGVPANLLCSELSTH